jgi:hypothetical protein
MDFQMPLLKHLTMLSPSEGHLKNRNNVGGPKFWAKSAKCGLNKSFCSVKNFLFQSFGKGKMANT